MSERQHVAEGIFRRNGNLQVIVWHKGKQHSWTEGKDPELPAGITLERAKRFRRRKQTEAEKGEFVAASPLTVRDAMNARIREYTAVKRSPNTIKAYQQALASFERFAVADVRLDKMTATDVTGFRDRMLERNKAKTVHLRMTLLQAAIDGVIRNGDITKNALKGVARPVVEPHMLQVLTIDEAHKLLRALDEIDGPYERFIAASLHIPVRGKSEMGALRWRDVDLEAKTFQLVRVRVLGEVRAAGYSKGKHSLRRIDIPTAALPLFERQRKSQQSRPVDQDWHDKDGLVWTDQYGFPLDLMKIRTALDQALRRAGLPRIRFHDLRHTNATIALHLGIGPKVVQERLGHANFKTTMDTYAHVMPGATAAMANTVGDALAGVPKGVTEGENERAAV